MLGRTRVDFQKSKQASYAMFFLTFWQPQYKHIATCIKCIKGWHTAARQAQNFNRFAVLQAGKAVVCEAIMCLRAWKAVAKHREAQFDVRYERQFVYDEYQVPEELSIERRICSCSQTFACQILDKHAQFDHDKCPLVHKLKRMVTNMSVERAEGQALFYFIFENSSIFKRFLFRALIILTVDAIRRQYEVYEPPTITQPAQKSDQ